MPNNPSSGSGRSYSPPQHLLTHWTAAELTSQFQAFLESLRYVNSAPELVFERLVGSLGHGFENTTRQKHGSLEELRAENKALHDTVDQLRVQLAAFHPGYSVQTKRAIVTQASSVRVSDPSVGLSRMSMGSPATISPSDNSARMEFKFIATAKRVGVTCTSSSPESPVQSGLTWEDIGFPDPDIQSGHEIFRMTPSNRLSTETIPVSFAKPFLGLSKVLVWFTHINYTQGPLTLFVVAMDQGATGFNLRIRVDDKSTVEDARVAWVAYPASRKDIASGFRGTRSDEDWKHPQFQHSGTYWVALQAASTVKVFVAVNALEMEESEKFVMEANGDIAVGDHRTSNFGWKISVTPKNARLYSAGIAYLLTG